MTAADDADRPASAREAEQAAVEPEWKRRARLAAVFGDTVPEQTGDDRDRGASSGKGDDWYRDQIPPHHG